MKIKIQSIAFNSKQELKDFVYEKVNTLVRFYRKIIGSEIYMKIDNSHPMVNKVCQIRLAIPGYDLWASARSETFEQATLKVIKALKKQIPKLKTNNKSNGRSNY